MTRFPELTPDNWTAEQRAVAETIASGPRGGVRPPFTALLHAPQLADRLSKLGEYLRFGTTLEKSLLELAIIITARHWTAQLEWSAHAKHALNAGLDPAIVDALAKGQRPAKMAPAETIVYEFSTELHRSHHVSDVTFRRAVDTFGHKGVADLIGLIGYYTTVAMVLNVGEIPAPGGDPAPLRPLDGAGS